MKTLSDLIEDELIKENIISYRHLTGIKHYPVLGFISDIFPDKLLDILRIESTPLIYHNSILDRVRSYVIESGNSCRIDSSYDARSCSDIEYYINQNKCTYKGKVYRDSFGNITKENINVFSQTQSDYEQDTLQKDSGEVFFCSPIDIPFQMEIENARWTSIIKTRKSGNLKGTIYQYPELGCITSQGTNTYSSQSIISDRWIKEVAKQNPKCRGFLLYQYNFISNINDSFPACGLYESGVHKQTSSPYLRFVHIRNDSSKSVKLDYLQIRCLQNHPYHLTDVTHRSRVLEGAVTQREEMNIILQSKQDLLIPIEFGFDTNSHLQYTSYLEDAIPSEWMTNELQLMIAKPVTAEIIDKVHSIKLSKQQINEQYLSTPQRLSKDFINQIKSISELKNSLKERLAIGTFFDVESIIFDGKKLDISSPNDNSKFSMSTYFGYGSCPYLLTFSKKGYWIEQGTILYGSNSKNLKAKERYAIDNKVLSIRIEERDREITFLEDLKLIYIDKNTGKQFTIGCLESNFLKNDSGYYLIHQGESLELNISNLIPESAIEIQLEVIGYYEILRS